jgi:hypothetical protein
MPDIIQDHQDNIRTQCDNDQLLPTATILFHIQVLLVNLAIREILSYNRWQIVHNFAIEKIPGYPIVNTIRAIHLFETDWNFSPADKFYEQQYNITQPLRNKLEGA